MPPNFGNLSFLANLVNDLKSLLAIAFKTPLQAIGGLFSFLASVFGVIGFHSGSQASSSLPSQSLLPSLFSARILVFLVIAGSIAWMTSLIGIWLTSRLSDMRRLIAYLVTAIGALFMAVCIDWIFAIDMNQYPIKVLFASVTGVTLGIFLAKTNFLQTLEPDPEIIATRAGLLMCFALVAVGMVIVVQLAGLSR